MLSSIRPLHWFVACFLTFAAGTTAAENSQDFGEYVVHFNALTTNMLPPSVAKQYDIKRSQSRAMLNVTVLRKIMGTTGEPVAARVQANATNLAAQTRDIPLREVREGNAIYYIGEFPVSNEEMLDFNASVVPEGESRPLQVRFRQQFFTH